ncbi:hypothetical protein NCCP28_24720 [Niallia sp. NCCP-28]|nr:hypothetical protein NCCP28_24720 [Niallia sp. NCCP-28]
MRNEEKKDMETNTKPIESTIVCEKDYEKLTDMVRNPAKPSKFVENMFKLYQEKKNN